MNSSTGSGGVVGGRSWWSAEAVVEGDGGGKCEEACCDSGGEAVQGSGAVAFEGEQVFAGVEDRLDSLSDRCEMESFSGLVFAVGADDGGVELGGGAFEFASGVALVAEHVEVSGSRAAVEQGEAGVAFGGLGRGESERAWGAVEREQAVQPEAPEVAAVAFGVAVVGRGGGAAAPWLLD